MSNKLIVIENDPVVSMDLIQTLRASVPDALVEAFQNLEEAMASIAGQARANLAVIRLPAVPLDCLKMKEIKELLSHRLVLLDDRFETAASVRDDIISIPRPFTDPMIAEALISLGVVRK